jgi:hypothetical protein
MSRKELPRTTRTPSISPQCTGSGSSMPWAFTCLGSLRCRVSTRRTRGGKAGTRPCRRTGRGRKGQESRSPCGWSPGVIVLPPLLVLVVILVVVMRTTTRRGTTGRQEEGGIAMSILLRRRLLLLPVRLAEDTAAQRQRPRALRLLPPPSFHI